MILLLTASLFFATLANHTAITIIISTILIAPVFYLYQKKKALNLKDAVVSILLFVLVFFYAFLFLLDIPNINPANEFQDAFISNVIKYCILILYCTFLSHILKNIEKNAVRVIFERILKIHICIFLIQFIIAYGFDFYLDFIYPFTGEFSRYKIYGVSLPVDIYRCTGLYIEPSTYSVSVFVLMAIVYHLNNKITLTLVLGFLTMILSMASITFVVFFVLFLMWVIKSFVSIKRFIFLFFSLFLVATILTYSGVVDLQMEKINNTSGIRFALLDRILERPTSVLLTGSGLYGIEYDIMEGAEGVCNEGDDCNDQVNRLYASPSDSGLLLYIFIKFGFLTPFILLIIIYPFIRDYTKVSILFSTLLTKLQFAFPAIWLLIIIYRQSEK